MKQTFQKLFDNETFVATLLIFLTTILTYAISIPQLGYYRDDWYLLWSGEARGPASIIPLFATDRPFMGVIYSYAYRLLGDTIVNWHLYALLWRFIGGLAFFWILRLLWPEHKYVATVMTVLFMIYPGFLSIPNANTKQNHLYGFGTALLSIALMLAATKTKNQVWKIVSYLLSLLLTANYLFIYEYMIGFEGARLALLEYSLYQDGIRKFGKLTLETLKRVWPYFLVTAGFLYWRIFIFEGERNATDAGKLAASYLSDFRNMSLRLILETVKDFLDTSIFAWFAFPYIWISGARYSELLTAVGIAVLVIALVVLYTLLAKRAWGIVQSEKDSVLIRDFVRLGAFIILCAIVPVIFSDRQVELFDAYKSYGLHPIPGVILFVAGIVLMLQPNFRKWMVITLIAISVTTQILNANNWAQYWEFQRQMWWQLTWRAPDIQDDTLVMTYSAGGYNPEQDYEIWGPLNLIYRPGRYEAPAIQAEVLNSAIAFDIVKREVRNNMVRDIRLHRDFNNVLLMSMSSISSCLHVLDGTLPVYTASEASLLKQVGAYSHMERIIPTATAPTPPSAIFGTEPEHNWCYYYQKASLARQTGDWQRVKELYREADKAGFDTDDKSEMIPYLEALVNLGNYEDARTLYNKEIKGSAEMRLPLCDQLASDPGYPPEFNYDYEMIHQILCEE
jgi:hypothetical protein